MAKKNIDEIINFFIEELKKEISLSQVILFGSCVAKKFSPYSDIDILIVSPDFRRKRYIKNLQYLFRKAARVNNLIEPIPATPEEIKYADTRSFLGQILKKGKIFYQN